MVNVKRLTVEASRLVQRNRVIAEQRNLVKLKIRSLQSGHHTGHREQYIENGTVEDSDYMLVNILRARQLANHWTLIW